MAKPYILMRIFFTLLLTFAQFAKLDKIQPNLNQIIGAKNENLLSNSHQFMQSQQKTATLNQLQLSSIREIQENQYQNQGRLEVKKNHKLIYFKPQISLVRVSQSVSQALIQSLNAASTIPKLETPKSNNVTSTNTIIQSNITKKQSTTEASNKTTAQANTQNSNSSKTTSQTQTTTTLQSNLRKVSPPQPQPQPQPQLQPQLQSQIQSQNQTKLQPSQLQSQLKPKPQTLPQVPQLQLPSQPQQTKVIKNRQFAGLGFYHDIPLTFRAGEYFLFHGMILNKNSINFGGLIKFNYINIVFSSWQDDSQFRCTHQIKDNKTVEFWVSCKIKSAGRYYLSIFPGSSGQTSPYPRYVVDQKLNLLPYSSPIQTPQNLRLNLTNNQLLLIWDSDANISNITIYQKTKPLNRLEYLLSNNHKQFKIPFDDFFNFNEIQTQVQLSHASSTDGTLYKISSKFGNKTNLKFNATFHKFDEIINNLATITPSIPWKLKVGESLKFNATFGEDIRNEAYFISPTGIIQTVNFVPDTAKPSTKIIKAGIPVNMSVSFSYPGTYLIQINAASGMALVNRPIYIGDSWPLLPDYVDLQNSAYSLNQSPNALVEAYLKKTTSNVTQIQPLITSSLDDKRAYLLHLLNGLRNMYKASQVYLDQKLNAIAQSHSDDMVARNYFSHTDMEGRGPSERAAQMNFQQSLGENIAQANSLAEIHLGLQRSADHLQNSVKKSWKRVGVGISINSYNQYVVAYQFSSRDLNRNPLTKDEFSSQKQNLIESMKKKYPNIASQNISISSLIDSWMRSDRAINLFNYIYNSGKYRGPMSYTSFTITYSDEWVKNVINSNLVKAYPNYSHVSVGLNNLRQNINMMEGFIVFS